MNAEMMGGTIRTLMGLVAGYMVAAGMSADQWVAITGGVVAVVTWGWSMWAKRTV